MALFNLIPFGVFDGYKIFMLNKKIWVAAFIPALILTVVTYLLFFNTKEDIIRLLQKVDNG